MKRFGKHQQSLRSKASRTDEQVPRESLPPRGRPRRRYLYEIEFFDAGHGRGMGAPIDAQAQGPLEHDYDQLFGQPNQDEGPRDPRVKRMIQAAANGWVVGTL